MAVAPVTAFLDLLLLHPLGGGLLVLLAFLIAAGVAVGVQPRDNRRPSRRRPCS